MAHLHAITDRGADLTALLREQQGEPSYRNPARRAAFMMAQRIAADPGGWHHDNQNAVLFMRVWKDMAYRMAWSSSIHPDLRLRLSQIADLT